MKNKYIKKITKILLLSFFVFIFFLPVSVIIAENEETDSYIFYANGIIKNKKFGPYVGKKACEDAVITEAANNGYTLSVPCAPQNTIAQQVADKNNQKLDPYKLLEPLPGLEDFNIKSDCPLHDYLNKGIKLLIGLIAVIAVVMIIMGGIQYMTSELMSGKANGKDMITNALFGLLLALASWLILDTINPRLLSLCLNGMPEINIKIIEPVEDDSVSQTAKDGLFCKNTAGAKGGYKANSTWSSQLGTQLKPTNDFLKFNNGGKECTYVGEKGCTSRYGLRPEIIQIIYNNSKKNNISSITVTGGTECWEHGGSSQSTTHRPGSATIDLRFETNLGNYIMSGTQTKDKRGNVWYIKDGVKYLKESDHWHAQL